MKRIFIFFGCIVFFAGCAGHKFTRLSDAELTLGKDTRQSLEAKIDSKPFQEFKVLKEGKLIKGYSYSYARSSLKSSFGGVISGRTQTFFFLEDVLVGYLFISSYEEDRTQFDSTKVEKIKKGETKRIEVIELLGQASGEEIYPLVPKETQKASLYTYLHVKTGFLKPSIYQQTLKIIYDENDVVENVEFTEAGNP